MAKKMCSDCEHEKKSLRECGPCFGNMLEPKSDQRQATKKEPAPKGTGKKVINEVVMDLKARSCMGEKKYGTPLRTFNGRNAMMDLYQELLDSVMYAKQVLIEMEDK